MITQYTRSLAAASLILTVLSVNSQNVGINATGAAPAASAILDLDVSGIAGTKKGLLVPRVTTVERTAIVGPATGLLVYDTTLNQFWYFNGVAWVPLGVAGWALTGNTLAGTEFMGSINAQAVRFFSSNLERMRINANGEVVAGAIASPLLGDLLCAVGNAANPWAVNGYALLNNSAGVYGMVSAAGASTFGALQGEYFGATTGNGARGIYGGTSLINTRAGVYGIVQAPVADGGAGVSGMNQVAAGTQHMGVLGQYNGVAYGMGVMGIGFGGGIPVGVLDFGVVGWVGNAFNYSGYFNGNHVVANGTKTASVGTSKGNQLLYVTETPGVWFEDIGSSQLVNGEAVVELDPLFLETIFIDADHPMHVFVQLEGDCNGVFVETGAAGFTVKELQGGTSSARFSYRVMAKRLNFQDHRFGNDPVWGAGDTRPYMQYAPPPAVDHDENVRLQAERRKNWKQPLVPAGFTPYDELQRRALERTSR